jgi:cytochrome bd ubiquinol oxidase subunit I
VMAYSGSLVALVSIIGAFLFWKRRLEKLRWFLWVGLCATALPFLACIAGWCLTEIGRQPWIVQGLLRTAGASSPNVGTTWLAISLSVFVVLYIALLVADFWLMRRYAGRDPSTPSDETGAATTPAIGY